MEEHTTTCDVILLATLTVETKQKANPQFLNLIKPLIRPVH